MNLIIKGGRVIDPQNNIDEIFDLLIIDDKISQIDKNISVDNATIIDATNKWVVPALIDLHVHLRDPGLTHKEDIITGANSAKAGGFTTICSMANTVPAVDNTEMLQYVLGKANETGIDVLPISAITKGLKGQELVDFEDNSNLAIAFSDDGITVDDNKLMREAIILSKQVNKPIFAHCEDHKLKDNGQIHEGETSKKLGLKGITPLAEDIIISRDILLAKDLEAKMHICHVATSGTIDILKEQKKYNKNLTAEVCPHHFVLCDADITSLDTNFKMAPPLRSKVDVQAMKDALKDGIIDVIATDHAPHSLEEKSQEFTKAPNGIVGLETLVPLTITHLVNENYLTPKDFVLKTSTNPAKIIGIDKGHLSVGAVADIAIIDTTTKYKIDVSQFHSKSKNSPFDGFEVYGKVTSTICKGKIVFERN